jgi:hypothetical protein
VKAVVVTLDERERGRMLLNFGHTLGHAVEALKGYRGVLHGEAVSMGMVFAARRSEALGIAPEGTADRLRNLLLRAGLPTELPEFPRRAYLSALGVDKKKRESRIRFVVLKGIGEADTLPLLPEEILRKGGSPGGDGRDRPPRGRRADRARAPSGLAGATGAPVGSRRPARPAKAAAASCWPGAWPCPLLDLGRPTRRAPSWSGC